MRNKPNIIIFNPDQWRGDVLGHMGNQAAHTPNIDKLIEEAAVSFASAFCQNPVCTPSRCSFMTGWYPHVRGHRTMHHMLHHELGEPNLLKLLKEDGYQIWWGGKGDLFTADSLMDHSCDIRFEPTEEDYERWGFSAREGNHGGDLSWRGEPDSSNYYSFFKGKLDTAGERLYGDSDWAMIYGAIDYIRQRSNNGPYCLYLPLSYPHPPYCVEEPWFSLTDRKKLPTRVQATTDWATKPSILKGIYEGQGLQDWKEEQWDELRATYYGMCSRLDFQFSMLVDVLQEVGSYDNSAIFIFSDHGDFTGDYGIVEKTQNTFQDCLTRVPFIIKPPASIEIQPGINEELVELVDFSATVYDLVGIKPNYDSFGKSLLSQLKGESQLEHRDAVFCEGGRLMGEEQASEIESTSASGSLGLYSPRVNLQIQLYEPYHSKAAMCRTKDYKYIMRLYEDDELYDLRSDPMEEKNLIHEEAYSGILIELKDRLLRWYMETCDVVPSLVDKRK